MQYGRTRFVMCASHMYITVLPRQNLEINPPLADSKRYLNPTVHPLARPTSQETIKNVIKTESYPSSHAHFAASVVAPPSRHSLLCSRQGRTAMADARPETRSSEQEEPAQRSMMKRWHGKASAYHAQVPYLQKLPFPAVAIIAILISVNLLVWAAVGIVLVCPPTPLPNNSLLALLSQY